MKIDFTDLYNQHYHRVYYAAVKVTKDPAKAEDVLQETFIKAYEKLGEVQEERKLGAWLSTIASRKAIDTLRKDKKLVMLPIDELHSLHSSSNFDSSDVEAEFNRIDLEERMKKKVSTLAPKLRVVFQLSYYQQLNEKEIASKLNVTSSAVKSRLHRARQTMKALMAEITGHNYPA
ncbi:RNA polymerase sigma factor [Halobacillus mangrovi]|uniref:RNA polymerase sigma factor n=1 Tax=Halobacillus mangrovi TaxID=402384 RepID=UPI003D952EEA